MKMLKNTISNTFSRSHSRRDLVIELMQFAGGVIALSSIGCAMRKDGSLQRDVTTPIQFVVMKDLFILRFTTDPGKPVEVLPVKNISEGMPTSFLWTEKTHSHIYTIDPSHYERLKRGETVVVTSDIQNGHTHSFMIDPKVAVESSIALRIPLRDAPSTIDQETVTPEDLLKIIG